MGEIWFVYVFIYLIIRIIFVYSRIYFIVIEGLAGSIFFKTENDWIIMYITNVIESDLVEVLKFILVGGVIEISKCKSQMGLGGLGQLEHLIWNRSKLPQIFFHVITDFNRNTKIYYLFPVLMKLTREIFFRKYDVRLFSIIS